MTNSLNLDAKAAIQLMKEHLDAISASTMALIHCYIVPVYRSGMGRTLLNV